MIYNFLKIVVQLTLRIFYREIVVQYPERLRQKGPLLLVVNHPNTLMDPLLVAAQLKQPVYFLTKSTFFISPLQSKILRHLNLIPIYRAQDVPPEQQARANDITFKTCYQYLNKGKSLLIFPEGTSVNERRLRPFKTGAARMALGAEAQANFKLGVKLLPVGLNYSDPTRFGGDVLVNVGEPIVVAGYEAAYRADAMQAAKQLTEKLEQELKKLVVITDTDEDDELLQQLEQLYRPKLNAEFPQPPFQLTKAMEASLRFFREREPVRVLAFKDKLKRYLYYLNRLRLHNSVLGDAGPAAGRALLPDAVKFTVGLVLGFPLYLYGLLFNYLPYLLPARLADWLVEDEEYRAPVMMVTGMFVFPLFYALLGWACFYVSGSGWVVALFLLSLPLSGFFVLYYWHHLLRTRSHWTLFTLLRRRRNLMQELYILRQQIFTELEQAKQEYLEVVRKE
ncbi:MAG: lysophospholipid acyltransferase family protein [Hymenobacteraceae bacterium]|nr:lysophospholipid acyltransferase family protein [Hymenobacteraceae bacterium]MDX5396478.1 lysophospholipid acyltransferase family protein [Hymenobacteraceae bacterium]MDX5442438.1 lysophospholipid acyltransferase family protein [Hymenobacteraceae bacterium]MDX5512539.1 lysophospholipid acyltransferase family protein [Hymenobacteraceae bacterium]